MSGTSSPQQRAKLAAEYLAERAKRNPKLTPSRTYCNSTQTEKLVAPVMQSGRGEAADQHFLCKSAGVVAQLRRNP